ncbi:hypothetical protein NEFER03_0813 [Nematocida sp. LUAm3]|nr:hypothetical protein NEFER03_0813 [Nematocida sp. LUAm3]KAI5174831.1 hypothetical protein NEFER02_0931 [Nematocida sp. LUAm2]KAI5177571.1 hypothetical protein NEFER01_0821 [Nematocida sp. LUAm1]
MRREEQEYEYLYKIVLIGDSGVGKTQLLQQLAHKTFSEETKSTIGVEFDTQFFMVDGKRIKAQIWDTAGQERYRAITSAYYRGAAGAIIVYDITREESFKRVSSEWVDQLKKNADPNIVISLVGNKSDLAQKREVSSEQAKEVANKYLFLVKETSAKKGDNVLEAFTNLIKEIHRSKRIPAEKTSSFINMEEDSLSKTSFWCC